MLDVLVSDPPSQEQSWNDGALGVKHCHDNSHSREDREREKQVARKRLYVASVVCLIFMTGEILGEWTCLHLTVLILWARFFIKLTLKAPYGRENTASPRLKYGPGRFSVLLRGEKAPRGRTEILDPQKL